MLTGSKVERFFNRVNQRSLEVVTAKLTRMEDSLIEFMDKRTFSQLSAVAEARTCEALGCSLLDLEMEHLPRALAVRVRFGQAGYSAAEIAILLDLPLVFVLAVIEKYGDDWPERMLVKTLHRFRQEHTLFKARDGAWHTPKTFAFVYGVEQCIVVNAVRLDDWRNVVIVRDLISTGRALARKDPDAKVDPFGPPCAAYRVPLFKYPTFATKEDYLRSGVKRVAPDDLSEIVAELT